MGQSVGLGKPSRHGQSAAAAGCDCRSRGARHWGTAAARASRSKHAPGSPQNTLRRGVKTQRLSHSFVLDNNSPMQHQTLHAAKTSDLAQGALANAEAAAPDSAGATVADADLTVYFDGACPLCQREIGSYQRLQALQPVRWCDVAKHPPDVAGLDQASALARFHVRDAQGRVFSGAAAFVQLWQRLPYWRHLAGLAQVPGVLRVLEAAYCAFLPLRPHMQAFARRRWARSSGTPSP